MTELKTLANAIRFLSIDAVEKAKSGHPGMPMGMADIATVLWHKYLKHNPLNPSWVNRDRFILSNGHGSMLLYSLLHLSGYDLSIDDLKQFRQLHSKTPGHPEYGYAPGIETTTGPLGQGVANAVGMAIAAKLMAERFNKPGFKLFDHYTYVFLGDGCLMEGISHEVSSLAGTLGLGNLIAFWDDNSISIDGDVKGWFSEDVAARYEAYGWQVIRHVNGHDFDSIDQAIATARDHHDKPTLICCKTEIGHGSPHKAGSHGVHGAPLGEKEVEATREALNWPYASFEIPDEIYSAWDHKAKGSEQEQDWNELFTDYKKTYPEDYAELIRRIERRLPEGLDQVMGQYFEALNVDKPVVASRKASQMALEVICNTVPEMFGGSADLTGSNNTNWSGSKWLNDHVKLANYLSYGVREFGMAAMMNGISLYGGLKPYGGTFLVFSDYARNAMRMSAIMKQPVVYVMTHDSIGLGEDGPTHQPIEQLASLRLIPDMNVWRPADAMETAVAWYQALKDKSNPSVLALSRQNLKPVVKGVDQVEVIARGGYLVDEHKDAEVTLLATGSEVNIMQEAVEMLKSEGIAVNLVSMPCVEKFLEQDHKYRHKVIDPDLYCVIMEAAQPDLWYRLLPKAGGKVLGLTHFGESAPADKLYQEFGLTAQSVVEEVRLAIGGKLVNE
ncbi:MAG: transketolase [Francisellaceae bacterium]